MAYTTHGAPTRHPTTTDTNHPGSSGIANHPTAALTNHPASGGVLPPPAVPTLTAPAANANVFNGIAVTVSATSTDLDLDRMDWVLDPGGSEVIVATDAAAPYSQSWTPTGVADGAHTLVARAVRGVLSTDSASITINVGEVLHTLVTSVTCLRAWQSDFGVTDAGGGFCSSWTDQKNGVNALQATGANQPAIVANSVGTRTSIRGDGSNDLLRDATLDLPAPSAGTPTFIWAVVTQRTWVASKSIFSSGTTGFNTCITTPGAGSTPQLVIFNAGSVPPSNAGAAVGVPTRIEAYFSNQTSDYLKAGTVTTTGTATGLSNPPAGFNMCAVSNGTGAANCDIYAVLVFSGLPSGAELAALSAAAAAMYPGVAV